jgi:hypothetical protein
MSVETKNETQAETASRILLAIQKGTNRAERRAFALDFKHRELRDASFYLNIGPSTWRASASKYALADGIAREYSDASEAEPTPWSADYAPAVPAVPAAQLAGEVIDAVAVEPKANLPVAMGRGKADMATQLAQMLSQLIEANDTEKTEAIDMAAIERLIDKKVREQVTPITICENVGKGEFKNIGVQHTLFPALTRLIELRIHAYLVGPAGSGKTSAGPQMSESSLLGFIDANGKCVRTTFREAYEHGGVYLIDEIDAASPAVLVVLNAALANTKCAFPDGMVERHPNFVLLAAANTFGNGADRQYVGRCQLDAATLDRYAFLDWPYDPGIEAHAAGVPLACFAGAEVTPIIVSEAKERAKLCEQYVRKVVAVRSKIVSFGGAIRHVVSPRASIFGCKMINGGFAIEDVMKMLVWKGLDAATIAKLGG